MKKIIISIGIAAVFVVVVFGLWVWSVSIESKNKTATQVNTDIIFFYGEECPHCRDVEKFIATNNIADKIKFDSLEVWHNEANKNIFLEKTKQCGLAEESIGVPLLYARGKCLIGTPNVEAFFKQEAGM